MSISRKYKVRTIPYSFWMTPGEIWGMWFIEKGVLDPLNSLHARGGICRGGGQVLWIPDWMGVKLCHQKTPNVELMLVYCWASVADAGSTLNRHWLNVLCLSLVDQMDGFHAMVSHSYSPPPPPPPHTPPVRGCWNRLSQAARQTGMPINQGVRVHYPGRPWGSLG